MNRRDFTKTLAALCCLQGVKLQDRYIVHWVMSDSINPEPVLSYREASFYNPTKYAMYIKVYYTDGTSEKYMTNNRNWIYDPATRGSDKNLIEQQCYIKNNNFVIQYNGAIMTYKDVRRIS